MHKSPGNSLFSESFPSLVMPFQSPIQVISHSGVMTIDLIRVNDINIPHRFIPKTKLGLISDTLYTRGLDGSRSIGWIILQDGTLYHTGFTGGAIWIDRKRRSAAILLTNRVHPDATKEGIGKVRERFYARIREGVNG